MGVSSYMVSLQNGDLTIYYIQLILNYLWPIIYFNFDLKLLALFILIILILLVIKMINQFKKYKFSHLLQIPYLIWLFVALFLNILSIFK
jgi:tryptophan-rich sensory protein